MMMTRRACLFAIVTLVGYRQPLPRVTPGRRAAIALLLANGTLCATGRRTGMTGVRGPLVHYIDLEEFHRRFPPTQHRAHRAGKVLEVSMTIERDPIVAALREKLAETERERDEWRQHVENLVEHICDGECSETGCRYFREAGAALARTHPEETSDGNETTGS